MSAALSLDEYRARIGREMGVSRWFTVDQALINAYAEISQDHQFIHTDPARAAAETPFGGTIAHGFLTVALLSAMAYDAQPPIAGAAMSINYGFDRLRFLAPVPAGARLRGRFTLAAFDERRAGEVTLHWDVSVEIEGQPKPALVARWIGRRYLTAQKGETA